tara:strand:+ start:128 stop:469 length:342 start_codon:yes stop_codon:yes gene_type:complete
MKKFLVYFGYLINFLLNTLPYTAPVFIVFYFYSMSQDPSDDGFGSLMFFISFFVSIYYYINLFEKKTGNNPDSSVEDDYTVLGYFRQYSPAVGRFIFFCIGSLLILLLTVRFG